MRLEFCMLFGSLEDLDEWAVHAWAREVMAGQLGAYLQGGEDVMCSTISCEMCGGELSSLGA